MNFLNLLKDKYTFLNLYSLFIIISYKNLSFPLIFETLLSLESTHKIKRKKVIMINYFIFFNRVTLNIYVFLKEKNIIDKKSVDGLKWEVIKKSLLLA